MRDAAEKLRCGNPEDEEAPRVVPSLRASEPPSDDGLPPFVLLDAHGWETLIREVVQNRIAARNREDMENEVWAALLHLADAQGRVRSAPGFVASVVRTQLRLWRKHEKRESACAHDRLDLVVARPETTPWASHAPPLLPPLRGQRRVALRDGVLEQHSALQLAVAWNQRVREVRRKMKDLAEFLLRWHRAD